MQERRELPRWHIGKRAQVRLGNADDFTDCYIEDMNLKSMRICLSEQLPLDRFVKMSLILSNNLDVEVEVLTEVPWAKEENGWYVYGVSLSILMDFDKDKVYQYISRNCFKQFKDKWWAQ